jgi:hypothetical protein
MARLILAREDKIFIAGFICMLIALIVAIELLFDIRAKDMVEIASWMIKI